ncbi:F-box/kelch-repeat protein At1g23390-like [Trifolium pratense]|uniref:F-box/kelch-repeat protein At1g23390-like n=1 Tax=Trifolium pratense TaxID=57577 RepID=UPI001E694B75|nr:F-box/kelch-repeat protein At1g23390-like [Trifolium pratense]
MATKKVDQEKELEDPIHGDILEATLSHVPLIYLVPASYVSKEWSGAVSRSLRHINPVKPWLMVHTQNPRAPHMTTTYAYDPRTLSWIEIHAPQVKHTSALRSSHSTLLYTISPTEFSFSVDPLHLMWHHTSSPRVWRVDPIVARAGNHIVVAGGACDFEDDPLAVEMYDMESHKWIQCQSMPEMMKDTTTLTWLSVVVIGEFLYLMAKNTGIMYSFNCKTMMWQGPYDLRGGEESVFYYTMGTVQNRLVVVVGIVGGEENVKGVKVWEIKEELELGLGMVELGVMPEDMVVKLRGESGSELLNSIELVSTGNFVYVYNASEPEEMVVCEVLKRGGCEWWSVRNAVVNDEMRLRRMVLCGGDVGLEDLKSAALRDCKFVLKQ